eukprot:765028-Prorocentrum_minimum.AAC.2
MEEILKLTVPPPRDFAELRACCRGDALLAEVVAEDTKREQAEAGVCKVERVTLHKEERVETMTVDRTTRLHPGGTMAWHGMCARGSCHSLTYHQSSLITTS